MFWEILKSNFAVFKESTMGLFCPYLHAKIQKQEMILYSRAVLFCRNQGSRKHIKETLLKLSS